jgi:hypothetical protein
MIHKIITTLLVGFFISSMAFGQLRPSSQASATQPKPAPVTVKSTPYYAFAHAVVDNGTLLISSVQEIQLTTAEDAEIQKQTIMSFRAENHLQFMRLIQGRFGKLMVKTQMPPSFNSISVFNDKKEADEARNVWLKTKEKSLIHVPDFKFSTENKLQVLKKDVKIE